MSCVQLLTKCHTTFCATILGFIVYITCSMHNYVCLIGVQCAGTGCKVVLGPPCRAGEQAW